MSYQKRSGRRSRKSGSNKEINLTIKGFAVFGSVAALGVVMALSSAGPADAANDKIRFRCKAETETVQMQSRYEERTEKARKEFRAQFEGSGEGLVAGAQLDVVVDEVTVGKITLVEEVPGQVEGQLRFDTRGRSRRAQPFPSGFPVVAEGTLVELKLADATVIACELN